jgi:hypothetical protein
VLVVRLLVEGSVEEHVARVAAEKAKFADSSITGAGPGALLLAVGPPAGRVANCACSPAAAAASLACASARRAGRAGCPATSTTLLAARRHHLARNVCPTASVPHLAPPLPLPGGFFDGMTSADQRRRYLLSILNAPSPAGAGDGDAGGGGGTAALLDARLSQLLARGEAEAELFAREDARRAAAEGAAAARWAAARGAAAGAGAGAGVGAGAGGAGAATAAPSRLATAEECADMIREAAEVTAPKPRDDPDQYGRGMPRAARQQPGVHAPPPRPALPPPAAAPARSAPVDERAAQAADAPRRARRAQSTPAVAAGKGQEEPLGRGAAGGRGAGASTRTATAGRAPDCAVEEGEEATSPPPAPRTLRDGQPQEANEACAPAAEDAPAGEAVAGPAQEAARAGAAAPRAAQRGAAAPAPAPLAPAGKRRRGGAAATAAAAPQEDDADAAPTAKRARGVPGQEARRNEAQGANEAMASPACPFVGGAPAAAPIVAGELPPGGAAALKRLWRRLGGPAGPRAPCGGAWGAPARGAARPAVRAAAGPEGDTLAAAIAAAMR